MQAAFTLAGSTLQLGGSFVWRGFDLPLYMLLRVGLCCLAAYILKNHILGVSAAATGLMKVGDNLKDSVEYNRWAWPSLLYGTCTCALVVLQVQLQDLQPHS